MIYQYKLSLRSPGAETVPYFWAYRLYAWLLEQIPEETASAIHNQEQRLLSQYISRNVWTISLFGEDTGKIFEPVLEKTEQISLHTDMIYIAGIQKEKIENPTLFLQKGREQNSRLTTMRFLSPTAFKQNGRYTIFPKEELLLQSLLLRWNEMYPAYLLDDDELYTEMKNGIHIVDYRLQSSRFRLKQTAVPCFYGEIVIEARLPVVLQEIWTALLYFSSYTGIGIKTTLGMGGVAIQKKSR